MYLIVNADDYGYSDSRDDGILECYRQGAVTNVSLMVNGYSASRAVKKAQLVGLPMGLHLNITEGNQVAGKKHQTLLNKDGSFHGKLGLRDELKKGTINLNEVETEIQAQIDKFEMLTGNKPISVDGHQHIHVVPGICEVFVKVLQLNNIKMSRLPIDKGADQHTWQNDEVAALMFAVTQQGINAVQTFGKHGIGAAAVFVGSCTMGSDMSVDRLKAFLLEACAVEDKETQTENICQITLKAQGETSANKGYVCELMVHPGNVTGKDGGCGNGPDWFSQSQDREHEMAVLMSKEMKDFYKDNHIKLIAFENCEV